MGQGVTTLYAASLQAPGRHKTYASAVVLLSPHYIPQDINLPALPVHITMLQAMRLKAARLRCLAPYWEDLSGVAQWPCASPPVLLQPQVAKAPWWGAWDRLVRQLVRSQAAGGDVEGVSPLADLFGQHAEQGEQGGGRNKRPRLTAAGLGAVSGGWLHVWCCIAGR